MALELKQSLKLSQQLVMTPQLQQAIKLLQLSSLELVDAVQEELMQNPVLEEAPEEESREAADAKEAADRERSGVDSPEASAAAPEEPESGPVEVQAPEDAPTVEPEPTADEMVSDVDWDNYMESRPQTGSFQKDDDDRLRLEDNMSPRESLSEHLMWQLGFSELDGAEREIACRVIYNLNENGFLEEDIGAIAERANVDPELAEKVLLRVQEFDPVGVAARSLAECLLVQARRAEVDDPLVLNIISEHLDLLQRRDFRGIARLEEVTIDDVATAADVISSFEPRPGREFTEDDPIYITPDIYVHKIGDEYHVVLNEDGLPKLRVSRKYREVLNQNETKETRDYVREKLRGAVWMIKSIHQRQRTISKVMQSILRFQREFFDRGQEYLRPLNLRDVAEDIGMHESTVSRVTTNKYVQTPHGVYELKFFFNSSIRTSDGDSIASESVKEKIRAVIAKEDPKQPLSDQRIAEVLRSANIDIARRTVTKYRESMKILSSTRRRQFR
ncbi:MAG: RNA polymerase factor sigma-54 [Deltaproteobacteria bacterium]|nr:RNA polymerase factor sigma-54 [Deltaproteobacteria bacterium]